MAGNRKKEKNFYKKHSKKNSRKPVTKKMTKKKKRRKKSEFAKAGVKKQNSAQKTSKGTKYVLNSEFEYLYELRDLILKSSPAQKDKIRDSVIKLGRIKLAIISGIFLDKESADPIAADLLIVADDIDRRKLHFFLKGLEADVGKEIKFAIMDVDEFRYRINMFDRFIRVLLEGPHEKLVDKLNIEL